MRLFEGIIVRPSSPLKKKPVPLIEGINVNQAGTYEPIDVESIPAFVRASSAYPFKIDVSESLRLHGAEPPFNINMVNVQEFTISDAQRHWEEDNPFVKMDEHGVITYSPQGNYLRNKLVITVEVADKNNPPGIFAAEKGDVYQGERSPGEIDREPIVPKGTEVLVNVEDDVIGSPSELAKFWVNQGANGTCLLAAIASILNSEGIADFEDILSRTVVRINAHGQIIDDNGDVIPLSETGVDILIEGQAPYIQLAEPLLPEVAERFEELSPGITRFLAPNVIYPNPNLQQNWGWAEIMFDAYDIPNHTGYASNFATILEELESGNKIVAYVDAKELWQSPLIDFIDGNDWIPFSAERSIQNHALWITGVEVEGDEAFIVVNDSGDPSGREARYPLEKFLDSFEDAEFIYQATGHQAPDNHIQTERYALQTDISNVVSGRTVTIGGVEHRFPEISDFTDLQNFNRRFNDFLKDPDFIDAMDAEVPGFKARVGRYIGSVNEQRERVIRSLGLDPDEIEKIFDDVDDE